MAEYIEREPLLAEYDREYEGVPGRARELIVNAPAADVAPVRHGRWARMDMHRGMEQYKCSVCQSECYVPECMGEPMYAYCPNCGADMREVDE